jgi:hypothetical protein
MGYPNLPGLQVTLNDLGLQVAAPPAGPKLTLLGVTSNTGIPLNEPLSVTNLSQAIGSFYAYPQGSENKYPSELALAIDAASAAGAGNIEVVTIAHMSGLAYEDYVHPTGGYSPTLTADSADAARRARYDDLETAYAAIQDRQFDIVHPVGAWADHSGTSGLYGKQLANFCHQVTTEIDSACIGVLGMMPVNHWGLTYQAELTADTTLDTELAALDDSVSGAELAFQIPSTALIQEWEKYASQTNSPAIDSLPVAWNAYLAGSEDETGTYYPTNAKNTAENVNSTYWGYWQATDLDGNIVQDKGGNKVDVGARISVVGAPLQTNSLLTTKLAKAIGGGAYISNTFHTTDGAAAYGGFITSLRPHSAPTNKQIATLVPQRSLSAAQANRVAGRRIVTFHRRSTGFVVSSAMTGAHNVSKYVRSDYVRLSTVRVVDACIEIVRGVGDRYIGEPNSAAMRNAMSAEIDKVFAQMKQAGALNDYQFFVSSTPDQQVLGEANIDLILVPAFELLTINVTVSLAKEL